MLKDRQKNRTRLGDFLIHFFRDSSRRPDDFLRLHNLVADSIKGLVRKWNLQSVVTDHQISDTILDFIEELTSGPSQSRFCSKLFAEVMLKSSPSREFIQLYAIRRLFTILKCHADSHSREYLRLDIQVKKSLQKLVQESKINFAVPDFFAAQEPLQVPEISRFQLDRRILAALPLRRYWSESGRSILNRGLKPSLIRLLQTNPHDLFKFRKRLISSTLFCLSDVLLQKQMRAGENQNSTETVAHFTTVEEIHWARQTFAQQLKSAINRRERPQILLLLIGYFFCLYPEYFREGDLRKRHVELLRANAGLVDRLFTFLRHSSLERGVELKWHRTTVYNRLHLLKGLLRSILSDCSVFAAQKFLAALLNSYLKIYHAEYGE